MAVFLFWVSSQIRKHFLIFPFPVSHPTSWKALSTNVFILGRLDMGEDAGFVLPAATRSTHAVTVITTLRACWRIPLIATSSFAKMLNKLFVQFVTLSNLLLKFAQTVASKWENTSATSANSSMMMLRKNNFTVMIVGSAGLVVEIIFSTARSVDLVMQLVCVIIICVWRTPCGITVPFVTSTFLIHWKTPLLWNVVTQCTMNVT